MSSDTITTATPRQEILDIRQSPAECLIIPTARTPLAECPTSLDVKSREGRVKMSNAMGPASVKLGPDGTALVEVQDYLIYVEEIISRESGECVEVLRTTLMNQQGECYRTTAPHAAKIVARWLQLIGPAPWAPPLMVCITARKGDSGRIYHDLKLAE